MSDSERIAELEAQVKCLQAEKWDLEVRLREISQGAQRVLGAMNNFVLNMTNPRQNKPTA